MHNWFFFTINLYNFILFILNNFFKKNLKIPTDGFTDGYSPSVFYWEMKNIYWKCHNNQRLHRRIESVCILPRAEKYLLDMPLSPMEYIHRYISSEILFCAYFSSVKPLVIFFLPTDLVMECGITDERDADRHFPSVI